ncbi:uncharacterized protein [Typha latifolia]|uniref:uncharacterized protein isoform X1 n=1 Tax=Typha latifolia TaxID=4733 RepID=UPI003C2D0E35
MAKAAVLESSSLNRFPLGRLQSDVKMKRKTPSELRGEQLKRRTGEKLAEKELPSFVAVDRVRKPEASKIPKYINTRVSEVYPVKKSSERCRVLYGKEKSTVRDLDSSTICENLNNGAASSFAIKGPSDLCALSSTNGGTLNKLESSDASLKDSGDQDFRKIEKCSQNALRNVVELHLGDEKLADSAKIDMAKALKGLISREVPAASSVADSFRRLGDVPSISSNIYPSEIHIPGDKAPFDFTLKTTLRLISSSSVKWCHRISANSATTGISEFTSQFCHNKGQSFGCSLSGHNATTEVLFSEALQSWLYPQSSLPPSIITAMASSTTRGEKDFLLKRQQDWEDSFQSLYYMLRKNMTSIFYVYTSQFVVLFIGGDVLENKHSCNAYLSQSTRGLRSLLRKNDVYFSMPLCHAEVEQATEADLVELSEIEKQNLGQTFHLDSFADVDNTPQSLLSFTGNKSVHALYDFLLNYRFFLNYFSGVDVPVLYSPVAFRNACLCVPEVKCKEMKRADAIIPSNGSGSEQSESVVGSASGICYSIEIKDTVLPPWVVCGICAAMSSDGKSFDSIFATEPSSIGLNIALDSICKRSDSEKPSSDGGYACEIPGAILVPALSSASVRRLKYSNGAYKAHVTHL